MKMDPPGIFADYELLEGRIPAPPNIGVQRPAGMDSAPPTPTHIAYEDSRKVTRRFYERSALWDALGYINGACVDIYQTIDDFVNSISRPRWVDRPGWTPFTQKSLDIGNYEYEVMVYRRPLSICERLSSCRRSAPQTTEISPNHHAHNITQFTF
eukprot:Gregarina_sp_Poly_1__11096@NODE_896_length_5808_cov_26_738025_g640_i0_p2_GENE_NODE_896_length_5808_cov_26_738025_g640_i0NODE_896_length_5808_cov_26_738025_g640_i0_p2_ORF_typecomplete_len155_score4_65DUF1427/PF07235_11/0_26_NODE_896_length_5808_cov_26_738025_g640_i047615225